MTQIFNINFDKYEFIQQCDHPDWMMDTRHVKIIHNLLVNCKFKRILEIGCYTGISTVAFIESLNRDANFELHLCEPTPTFQLMKLIDNSGHRDRIVLHQNTSKEVMSKWGSFDLVCVDGDHRVPSVGWEILCFLRNRTKNIIAHDTNASTLPRYGGESLCGAELLGRVFKNHKDYYCIEDKNEREGENTDRGLFFCTRDLKIFETAKEVYQRCE